MLDRATRVDGREKGVMGNKYRKASLASQKMKVLVDHYSTFKGRMNIILSRVRIGRGRMVAGFLFPSLLRFRSGNFIIKLRIQWNLVTAITVGS